MDSKAIEYKPTTDVSNMTLTLDKMGPVIINSDGTIGRIGNWHEMTPEEQERTKRVVAKRNKARIDKLNQQDGPSKNQEQSENQE